MLQEVESPLKTNLVLFRKDQDVSEVMRLLSERPMKVLVQDEEWELSVRRFEEMIGAGVFKAIKRLNITSLKIRWGNSVNLIKEVNSIRFPCLKNLILNGNMIENIEAIAKLNLQSVQVLNLKQNNIRNLKPLRKCKLSSLKELTLYKNRIVDFRPLQEMQAPLLANIWTTPQTDTFDCHQANTWIFRIESNRLQKAYIKHPRGQMFDFETIETMGNAKYSSLQLVYRMRDDIHVRLE